MTTISEFIDGKDFEVIINKRCSKYREMFLKIIEKKGVGNSDIKDEIAIKSILSTPSWNWAAFLFSTIWAIYRKDNIFGWGVFIVLILLNYITILFAPDLFDITTSLPYVVMVIYGIYGNSFALRNSLQAYANTKSPKEIEQCSTSGVILAFLLVFASTAGLIYLIGDKFF